MEDPMMMNVLIIQPIIALVAGGSHPYLPESPELHRRHLLDPDRHCRIGWPYVGLSSEAAHRQTIRRLRNHLRRTPQ
jgi:hypothetical protein